MALPRYIVTAPARCKIVYVCRDPNDTLVSFCDFRNKQLRARQGQEPLDVEAANDFFIDDVSPFGPYWDHVLAHLACLDRVLFFRYEEMWRDPAAHVRRLVEFVGLPFGAGEEEDYAAVDTVVRLCSFERMSGAGGVHGDGSASAHQRRY
ncbi:hypothetical protein BAE44_0021342 [Dichanthelium oligosanthes]|uniref:Sulfotransferase n=1 Tax=Dichanthelium oligosanthes TaxID=888268 RepID=A0A1E5UXM2_9POAL|nr:hypothetical protein BAE44_0021342 [Dichanthelium oligosanthes]